MSFENGVFLPVESLEATSGNYSHSYGSRSRGSQPTRNNSNSNIGSRNFQRKHRSDGRSRPGELDPHHQRRDATVLDANPKPPSLMELVNSSSSTGNQFQERQDSSLGSGPIGNWGSFNPNAPVFQPVSFNIGRENTDTEISNRRGHSNRNQNQSVHVRDSGRPAQYRNHRDSQRSEGHFRRDSPNRRDRERETNNSRPFRRNTQDLFEATEENYEQNVSHYNNSTSSISQEQQMTNRRDHQQYNSTQRNGVNWMRKNDRSEKKSSSSNNWRSGESDQRESNYKGRNSNSKESKGELSQMMKARPAEDESQLVSYPDNKKIPEVKSPRKTKPDIRNQRETLMDQLSRNSYDCMICVEKVRRTQPTWSCPKCYNVFHYGCINKWASSSVDDVGWRCPGCQSYCDEIPTEYRCFCGATKNPHLHGIRSDIPHSCGQTCSRKGIGGIDCTHSCPIQCHPGPCPPCEAIDTRMCCCGKTSAQVKCSSKAVLTCRGFCDKLLNCGIHKCTINCHTGTCEPCSIKIQLECYCSSEKMEVLCNEETSGTEHYCCAKQCGKALNCKKHFCEEQCHPGLCKPCKISPQAVLSCPCGQTSIAEACLKMKIPLRKSCMDPIPTCGKICAKILPCGIRGESHTCKAECHVVPKCPPCSLSTPVKCRCGNKCFEIPCEKFNPTNDVLCEKKCTKKRSCGKHKCNTKCCIDPDHICPIVCDRSLRCGNHKCALLCHNGHCPTCRIASFEELACECGASIIYPPVSCGTKPPPCQLPCSRTHPCEHPVLHNCHSEVDCPPCTVLTQKWCNGKHELRKNVMCYIQQVSCGMPCKKLLPCGRHKCIRVCHADKCLVESCKLPCEVPRIDCGHSCGAPCHDGLCSFEDRCKQSTEVTCECGRKKDTMICWKREKEYDRLVFYLAGLEIKRLRNVDPKTNKEKEPEINEAAVHLSFKEKTPKANVLECDKECARIERNRKMIEALQLEDPDVTSTFGTPNYSDFLITFTKKNPQFVENIHERLTSLVVKAQRSKRKNETYGFESMNRDKRHFVHEYSVHFGALSESFDEEPNRSIICTASKDKSYLPSVNLIDAVFRPNLCSERKNAFNDVEIFQNSKSQIMRPANGKIVSSSKSSSGMVALMGPGPSTTTGTLSNGDYPPLS